MQVKSNVSSLPLYQPGMSADDVMRKWGLINVIKLASNENPFGCSPTVIKVLQEEALNLSIYPDGSSHLLAEAVAAATGVAPSQLIFGAGSDEVITMICRAYLNRGDQTIMAEHTFPQYETNASIEGAECIHIPNDENGGHDLEAMLNAITKRTKIVWICNPNNPTGTIVHEREVVAFMERVPEHVMIVLDEAYCEYVEDPDYPDSLALFKQYSNLVLLRTFSKIYGLAALRVGYGIAPANVVQHLHQVRGPFNTTRLSQAAAIAALGDQSFISSCRQQNSDGRQYLLQELKELGLASYPSHGNFIMFHLQQHAEKTFSALLKKGVIVRGGHKLGFPESLRVTIGSHEQNERFVTALREVLLEVGLAYDQ